MAPTRFKRTLLIVLNAFLAVTAIAGGIGLLTGVNQPPLAMLKGSPFHSYMLPGLALTVLVGGSALLATVLLLRRHARGTLAAIVTGGMIISFEIVEVLIIGSEPGVARTLQAFYVMLGLVTVAVAMWMWSTQQAVQLSGVRHDNIHEP